MKQIIFEISEDTFFIEPDYMTIHRSYEFANWINNSNLYQIMHSVISNPKLAYNSVKDAVLKTNGIQIDNAIAVGSIEYTEQFLGKAIKPILIPKPLKREPYLDRHIIECDIQSNDVDIWIDDYNLDKVFIKPLDVCKSIYTGCYTLKDFNKIRNQLTGKFLLSEVINIIAEWRCFIYHNKIMDIRKYLGDINANYNLEFIKNIVSDWTDSPPAYTLDVGMKINGKMTIIEIHNFLSCGLYGFEDLNYLWKMTNESFKFEKEH